MQLFIISVVCQLAALPILLYHFYEVSVLGVLLNVLYVPLYSTLLLPFSIIALLIRIIFSFVRRFVDSMPGSDCFNSVMGLASSCFSYATFVDYLWKTDDY